MSHAPNDYALVIGINDYPNWANGKKSLRGPVHDAENFHDWLIKDTGGGLKPENARLVVSTADPIGPLQNIIDEEFKVIRSNSKGLPRRRFYFYFGGHGHSPAMSANRQALCLANWSVEDQGAALQLESYLNASVGCLNFEEGLFFLDCCRVREATPLGKSSDLECGDPKLQGKHYVVFYGAEHYQPGYEDDAEDTRGFFTRALVNILNAGTIEAQALEQRLGKDTADLARPRNQVARALRYANREIYLGPPLQPAPEPSQPEVLPSEGRQQPERDSQLEILLQTNLSTAPAPGDFGPPPAPGEITVSQGDKLMWSTRGTYSGMLPLGPYRVTVAHGEAVETHEIDLQGNMSIKLPLPRRHSAAPLSSTKDKMELITDPIIAASTSSERTSKQSIFVALRARTGPFVGDIAGRLNISRPDTLESFDVNSAHALFPARRPGMYELRYNDPAGSTLMLSIPVAQGWDTQIFVVEDQGRFWLDRASIFMQVAGQGFNPADALNDAYEVALSNLVTGGPGPDQTTMNDLLYGKFRNPLFGLVGAHFLLRELSFSKEREEHRHQMLDIVINNLGNLLSEDSPDVIALHVLRAQLSSQAWGEGVESRLLHVESPPLLRASWQALIEATADQPAALAHLDETAIGAFADSPWVTWRPPISKIHVSAGIDRVNASTVHSVEMRPSPRRVILESIYRDENFRVSSTATRLEAVAKTETPRLNLIDASRLANLPDWVVDAMRGEIEQSDRVSRPVDFKRLVRRLGLPRGLLEQAERIVRKEQEMSDSTTTDSQQMMARG